MPQSDAFAFKNSGLNDFLFAEVGNEVNGSPLTILSVLARLGQDPWTEAARLAKLPKPKIIDYLVNGISQMPLCPQALTDARITAARVILLLPSQRSSETVPVGNTSIPRWVPLAVVFAAIAFGIVYELIPPAATTDTMAPLSEKPAEQPKAPH